MLLTKHTGLHSHNTKREILKILYDAIVDPIMHAQEEDYCVTGSIDLIRLKKEIVEEMHYVELLSVSQLFAYLDDLTHTEHYRERDVTLRSLGLPTFDSVISSMLILGRSVPSITPVPMVDGQLLS